MRKLLVSLFFFAATALSAQVAMQAVVATPHYALNAWTFKAECYGNSAATVQGINCVGGATTCAVNTTSCGIKTQGNGGGSVIDVGDTVICAINGNNYSGTGVSTISSISGETWVLGTSGFYTARWISNAGSQDMAYVLRAVGGETSLSNTTSVSNSGDQSMTCVIGHWGGNTAAFDNAVSVITAACTSCSGSSMTLSGTNDFALSMFAPQNNATAVNSPWSANAVFPFGDGIAPLRLFTWTTPVFTQSVSAQTTVVGTTAIKGS